jgi:hypothetical protein
MPQPLPGVPNSASVGIDGRLYFHDDNSGSSRQVIFSIKGGHNIGVSEVRDLIGVLQREKAPKSASTSPSNNPTTRLPLPAP